MVVRRINNPRGRQSMSAPENPPARKPEPVQPPPPQHPPPEKGKKKRTVFPEMEPGDVLPKGTSRPLKRAHPRKSPRDGTFNMTRQDRSDGFGLYVCGNCKWYDKIRPPRIESCKDCDVPECALPCTINKKQHGYFEPKRLGQAAVKKINISHLDPGELLILAYRCRKEAVAKVKSTMRNFRIGDRVRFYLNKELCFGEVARLTKRYVVVEPDHGGGEISLKPFDVSPEDIPENEED